jgi:hypothetical protein
MGTESGKQERGDQRCGMGLEREVTSLATIGTPDDTSAR